MDNKANLTLDFGYYKLTIGDQLWFDTNNNGIFDTGENTVGAGITVDLLDSTGSVIASTTTDTNGKYLFDHSGTNTPLQAATTYQIKVIPPTGYQPSGTVVAGVNNNNNGTLQADNSLTSGQFTLKVGDATFNGQTVDNPTATTANPTLDFGIYKLTVGDQLWYDTNNNGSFDTGTESNVGSGVTVQLLDSTNAVIATTITNANGLYLFDHNTTSGAPLQANTTYHINIPTPPTGFVASTIVTPGVNNANNGTT